MHRIVVTGAESTGKTTLAKALSGYYGEPWTPEFVREFVKTQGVSPAKDDLDPIARGQLTQEDLGARQARRIVFHDTNLLSSIIYANAYFDTVLDWVNDAFLSRDYTLYLFCQPDFPWVEEPGQRESPDARERFHRLFRESLERLELPFVEIAGDPAARLAAAIRAIDAAIGTDRRERPVT